MLCLSFEHQALILSEYPSYYLLVFLLSLCSWRLEEKHCTLFLLPLCRFELLLSCIIPHEA